MKACVTGGAGLIGSHIVDLLLDRDYDVVVVDNLDPAVHPHGLPDWVPAEVEVWKLDIRDPDARLVPAGADVVFHQAAFGGFDPNPIKTMETNVLGTLRVLEQAREAGVGKIIVASSQAVYGSGSYLCDDQEVASERSADDLAAGVWEPACASGNEAVALLLSEESPVRPRTPYALSKHYAERSALELGLSWGIPVVALRYALTYGPRQSVHNPYTGICSIFSTRILNGLPAVVYEDGRQTRDFTYALDVARANVFAAVDPAAEGVYNVGTGIATTISGFVRKLALALDRPEAKAVYSGSYRPGDARHVVTDPSRIMSELGWQPRVSLYDGLCRYAEWLLSCPTPPERFSEAERFLQAAGVVRPPAVS